MVLLYGFTRFDVYHNDTNKYIFYWFECVVIILVMGLRYEVGGDSFVYQSTFASYPPLSQASTFDFDNSRYGMLWNYFVMLCRSLSAEYYVLFLAQATIVNVSFFRFFKKYSDRPFLAVLLFYLSLGVFIFNTEIMRAAISVSIFLWAFDFLIKKKYIIYYLFVLLAIGFHTESFVLIIYPLAAHLLKRIEFGIKNITILLVASFVVIASLDTLGFLYKLFGTIEDVTSSFDTYMDRQHTSVLHWKVIVLEIIHLTPFVLLLWYRRKSKDYINSFIVLYIFFRILAIPYGTIASRTNDFTFPFIIVALASTGGNYVKSVQLKSAFNYLRVFTVCYFFYLYCYLVPLVYPYSSIFIQEHYAYREPLYEALMAGELTRDEVITLFILK